MCYYNVELSTYSVCLLLNCVRDALPTLRNELQEALRFEASGNDELGGAWSDTVRKNYNDCEALEKLFTDVLDKGCPSRTEPDGGDE